eukprot:888035_1
MNNKQQPINDAGKNFECDDIPIPPSVAAAHAAENSDDIPGLWERFTKNPDNKLVTVNACNQGFQSKINKVIGSYMIYEFVEKMLNDLQNNNGKNKQFLYEILDKIQSKLGETKQLPTFMYNNNTRYIKFMENSDIDCKQNEEEEVIEMIMMEVEGIHCQDGTVRTNTTTSTNATTIM